MAWLSAERFTQELHDGEVVVGSGSEADCRVPTADLMPRHFMVLVHGLNASIRPCSNDNVVVVNGRQISGTPWTLHDGDLSEAGSGQFVYGETAPLPPPPAPKPLAPAYLLDEREKTAYQLLNRSTGIGRDGSNAVIIRDPMASRFHAEIRRESGGYALHARGSAGTTVNDRRVSSACLLEEGDVVEIAYTALRFTKEVPPTDYAVSPVDAHAIDTMSKRPTIATHSVRTVPSRESAGGRQRWVLVAVVLAALVAL